MQRFERERFSGGLGASGSCSSCGGVQDRSEEDDGLSYNISCGISVEIVAPRSSPSCDGIGDGYSLRVHNESERENKEGRAARARACEASSTVARFSGLSFGSDSKVEEGVS
jgi:hypothetical protein